MRQQTEMYQKFEVGDITMVADDMTRGCEVRDIVLPSGEVERWYIPVDVFDLTDPRLILQKEYYS